jgi:Ca2+-binding RTX toxin-like protein
LIGKARLDEPRIEHINLRGATLFGTASDNVLDFSNTQFQSTASIRIVAGDGADTIVAADPNDVTYVGGVGSDSVTGGDGNDQLQGDQDNDLIDGGDGNDFLLGGAGDDTMDGGSGNDTFVFADGSGNDTINGFVAGAGSEDVLDVTAFGFADFNAVLAATTDDAGNAPAVIQLDSDGSITLVGVTKSQLNADDFLI